MAEAYIRGLERLVEAGGDPSRVASVASFFVSRVDTEADRRLEEVGGPKELEGTLAIANAKLAYQRYKEIFAGERWEALAARGASAAALPVGLDVDEEPRLPGRHVRRGADRPEHGEHDARGDDRGLPGPRRASHRLSSRASRRRAAVFERFAEAGVDYDDVTRTLEREGVEKFADSFAELLEGIRAKSGELVTA